MISGDYRMDRCPIGCIFIDCNGSIVGHRGKLIDVSNINRNRSRIGVGAIGHLNSQPVAGCCFPIQVGVISNRDLAGIGIDGKDTISISTSDGVYQICRGICIGSDNRMDGLHR